MHLVMELFGLIFLFPGFFRVFTRRNPRLHKRELCAAIAATIKDDLKDNQEISKEKVNLVICFLQIYIIL